MCFGRFRAKDLKWPTFSFPSLHGFDIKYAVSPSLNMFFHFRFNYFLDAINFFNDHIFLKNSVQKIGKARNKTSPEVFII